MNFMLGITFSDWTKLLIENKFSVSPKHFSDAFKITAMSIINSRMKKKEDKIFYEKIKSVEIKDPIFIIGHWRSGTSLVHKLLSLDSQFAYPNLFQVTHPHTFLYREKAIEKALGNEKAEKRPMDNMKVTFKDPGEDESAISVLSLRSPLVSWGFPKNNNFYSSFHTFENAQKEDFEKWKNALLLFLKKLTLRYDKTIILKSPVHTGRIKIFLDLFPNAKFIHIYRNPYDIFNSTKKLYNKMLPTTFLQKDEMSNWEDYIIQNYKTMYKAYFDQKKYIPKENLIEFSFENFEKDKLCFIKQIYEKFSISDFDSFEPRLIEYLKSINNYKKNEFNNIDDLTKKKITENWDFTFSKFGYEI
ncbi:MAG: sulfotransferase [Ignavibacteriales bacterium]|nr:sulfotransferase [Ignavibacteriales bacterium]